MRRGRIDVDGGEETRFLAHLVPGAAVHNREHVDCIADPLPAQSRGMPDLVGECQDRVDTVEMACFGIEIDRRHGHTAAHLQDIEALHQPDVVLEIGEVARPAAAIEIAGIGRTAHRIEGDMVGAEGDGAFRIARAKREFSRRPGNKLHHECPVETDEFAGHFGTGSLQMTPCLFRKEFDAEFLEHAQRRLVDRLEMVRGNDLDRRIGILQTAPRQLLYGIGTRPPFPPASTSPVHGQRSSTTRSRRTRRAAGGTLNSRA